MRILVIGGSGFIGPPTIQALSRMGHRVALFHRGRSRVEPPDGVDRILGDRNKLPEYAQEFRRFAPDVIIDFILSSGRQAGMLMDTFRGIAGRVVAVSSGDVYRAAGVLHGTEPGDLQPMPLTEGSQLRTNRHVYMLEALPKLQELWGWLDLEYDKIPVERAVLGSPDLPGTILRLPMTFGPGDRAHRLFPTLKRIDDGRPAMLLEETIARWRGPRGYVEDVAAAIALAAVSDRARGRVYNVAWPDALSELEWTKRVTEAAGFGGEIIVLPKEKLPAHLCPPGNHAQHWVYDTSRIRTELGYREVVPFKEALLRTIAWERAHPPAEIDPRQFDYAAEDAAREAVQ